MRLGNQASCREQSLRLHGCYTPGVCETEARVLSGEIILYFTLITILRCVIHFYGKNRFLCVCKQVQRNIYRFSHKSPHRVCC